MEPTDGVGPFDDPEYRFEPWWPGAQVIVSVDGAAVHVASRDLSAPLTSFPELAALARLVEGGAAVLDGTLLVLVALVLSDLLWAEGRDLTRLPFAARLERLTGLLRESDWCMVGRGFVGEGLAVAAALEAMGLPSMSARHLDSPYRSGPSEGNWLRLPLHPSPPDPDRRPTLALLQRLGL